MARLYAIGPVTGIEDDNRPAFKDARERLKGAGYTVDIPHDRIVSGAPRSKAMLVSINTLTGYDYIGDDPKYHFCAFSSPFPQYNGVALLDGWEQSEGARTEKLVAEACGIPCKTVDEWIEEVR